MVGSPFYLAPELRKVWDKRDEDEGIFLEYDPWKSDVYSLGVTLCDICQLEIAKPQPITEKIIEIEKNYGNRLAALITKMLEVDFNNRWDFLALIKSAEYKAVFLEENFPKVKRKFQINIF